MKTALHSQVVVVYGSNVDGYLKACNCPGNLFGGLIYSDGVIQKIRSKYPETIFLDGGDLFPSKNWQPKADYVINLYNYLQLDALNIGDQEFWFGTKYLLLKSKIANFDFISANIFQNGKYQVAKKMVLVPFGEYIPLPKFAQKFINDTFFSGASDFVTAKKPTDFFIKGEKFRNAICYEATCQEIYEGDVKFAIAISNNAWFAPSIEPTIQNLLLRYYARKNGVTIYHCANYKGTAIVK